MLLGLAFILALVSVPLAGGRLSQLAQLRFRLPWLAIAGLGLQVLVISLLPATPPQTSALIHVASYVLLGAFVAVNIRLPGMFLLAAGGLANALAIVANNGVMPASASALRAAGLEQDATGFVNSGVVAHPHLAFLGDRFAVPASLPAHNVFSVGDVLLAVGLLIMLHLACTREQALGPAGISPATYRPPEVPGSIAPPGRRTPGATMAGGGSRP